jgi:enoyl-CoA hydratase/carnithine racemase
MAVWDVRDVAHTDAQGQTGLGLEYAVGQDQETTHDSCQNLFALLARRRGEPSISRGSLRECRCNYFSAHVDLAQVPQLLVVQQFLPGEFLGMLYRRLSTAPVVSIAKVAARVRGAGNEFILACDMCFASRGRAVFGQMEAGLGPLRVPEAYNTYTAPKAPARYGGGSQR